MATKDWHPPGHSSFESLWPPHCVQGTPGAELHEDVPRDKVDVVLDKGQDPGTDGYSAFDGTDFGALLRERGVDRITLVGLATDYCVKNTALDALRAGFAVRVDASAIRGVEVEDGDSQRAIEAMREAGAVVE